MWGKLKFKVLRKVHISELFQTILSIILLNFPKNLHNLRPKIFEASKILRHLKMNQRWIFGQKSSKLRRSSKLRCNTGMKRFRGQKDICDCRVSSRLKIIVLPSDQKYRSSGISIIRPDIGVHIASRTEHYIRYRRFWRKKSSETGWTNLSLVEVIANFIRSTKIKDRLKSLKS